MLSYTEALAWLDDLLRHDRPALPYEEVRLRRIRSLLTRLGSPHERLTVVLVAGTKGKGSTAAMLAAILQQHGQRIGLYSKPHLVDYRERIRVDGTLISPDELARLIAEIKPAVEAGDAEPWGRPTYFEVAVALALLHFMDQRVDVAVMEAGIGGRLDATNVCDPRLSVITPVSYDHMDVLGNTLRQIATEEAGIVRPGGLAVTAPQTDEARDAILETCRQHGARLVEVGRDVTFEISSSTLQGVRLAVRTPKASYEEVHVPLLGRHQATNAAVAVAAAESLRDLNAEAVRGAFAGLRWPARSEILADRPTVVVDVAHNPASIGALRATIQELFRGRRIVLVFGMIASHDPAEPAELLVPLVDEVVVTTPLHVRPVPADEMAEVVRRHNEHVTVCPDREGALEHALSRTGPDDVLLVTGSFFLVGMAREWLLERVRRAPVS